MENQKFDIVTAQSSIDWTGRKVTGPHNGTIGIKSGSISFSNGQLTGGEVIVDTTSILILDVTDPATNAQFAGHLASDDFFSSEQYPEAKLIITGAEPIAPNAYQLSGNLTIKGITHPITFAAEVNANDSDLTAAGKIIIDRTRYNMKFRSGNFFLNLGDTLIYNDFELDIKLTAKAVAEPALA
ncbi:polyisoprenoid-binding protein YceI [Mucilaginibacter yixingensis]|uniref:Polyisoprenoid-binding protein YceI n=1 Tax=Mucilaginibacter yixingensis TaxID=1295612 RepID=A0A2T5JBE0_9SPHI|nr:YceI family protein [Mucilaginibacter yixingensis]PTQ98183.1 polyisoprenoid-binding protein YceI [Mucilaginibacter yixingensis]